MLKKFFTRSESGQAIIIIVIGLIGILAMIGLMIDGGVLFIDYARLKRATDAAALAASLQYREGYTISQLSDSANEFIRLNEIAAVNIQVDTCDTDASMCSTPPRKLVRIRASKQVNFGFLPVIGIRNTIITTTAVSEAASVDVVLVIDSSGSMAFESTTPLPNPTDPSVCNPAHTCQPFEQVKDVAKEFVQRLYFPYDRVAVVTFDRNAHLDQSLLADETATLNTIDALTVYQPPACDTAAGSCLNYDGSGNYLGLECPLFRSTGDPSSCGSSNIGGGLGMAGNEFAAATPVREDSLWVVILLAGGPANATNADPPSFPYGYCPSADWVQPFCRDASAATRHANGDLNFDADDYARDMADFVTSPDTGQGAVLFSIGLGDLVQHAPVGDPDAAEKLLQYAALDSGGATANHGAYYYAPSTAQLRAIFRDIAENIATRLTH